MLNPSGIKILDFGDRRFYFGLGKGEISLSKEDATFYKKIFGLKDFDASNVCKALYEQGKLTFIDSSKKEYSVGEDKDFNFGYWFPELEAIAGGTSFQRKKLSKGKKIAIALSALGITAMFLGLPSLLHNNSPTAQNDTANCQTNLAYITQEKTQCKNFNEKLLEQLNNQTSILSSCSSSLENCRINSLNLTKELSSAKEQLNSTRDELSSCKAEHANISAKLTKIQEFLSD